MTKVLKKKLSRKEEDILFSKTLILYQFEEVLDDVEFGELSSEEEYVYYYSNYLFETTQTHKKIFTFTNDKAEYEEALSNYYESYDVEDKQPLDYYKIENEFK